MVGVFTAKTKEGEKVARREGVHGQPEVEPRATVAWPIFAAAAMRRFILTPLRWLGASIFWGIVVTALWVLLLKVADPPVTMVMAEQAHEQESFARTWKDLDEMSLWMPLAVIASEDQKFMDHHGFDMEALEKAWAEYDKPTRRKKLKGASSLSQQTAKNVFLWDGRTLLRKGCEAWFTILIETFWSKERILEVYLNVAETGKGRFGAEAAAQGCFGKSAAKLSQREAALIAVQLPSPRRYSCKRPGPFTTRRAAWVVRNINNLGNVLDPAVRAKNTKAREEKEARKARRKKKVVSHGPVRATPRTRALTAQHKDLRWQNLDRFGLPRAATLAVTCAQRMSVQPSAMAAASSRGGFATKRSSDLSSLSDPLII